MRAVVVERYEDVSKVRVADMPVPKPGPGQVLIQIAAAGVNPVDWKECEGRLRHTNSTYKLPFILGFDAAGRVAEIGPGANADIKVGDKVMVFSNRRVGHNGTYAEFVSVPDHLVADMPKTLSFVEAASMPAAAMTGYQMLFRKDQADVTSGAKILIHGAAGGVGGFAVQFAKNAKISIAGSCRGANLDYIRELGAEIAIDYNENKIVESVRQWAPGGVDAILDCVSGGTLPLDDAIAMLKPGGKLLSISTVIQDGDIEGDTHKAAESGVTKIFSVMNFDDLRGQFRPLSKIIDEGGIRMPVIETMPLQDAAKALAMIKAAHVRGKLVLKIADL